MQAIKGYVENGLFYPMEKLAQTQGRIKAVLTILDEPVEVRGEDSEYVKKTDEELEAIRQARLAFKGCMKGKIWMSDDFDEPLEEMREYME